MKGTWKGFDPEIEKEYAQDSTGSVIGRVKSSPVASMPDGLSAQEQQDWILAQRNQQPGSAPESEEMDGKKRVAARVVQSFQLAARAKGLDLGALSISKILELADKGELKGLEPAVEQVRKAASNLS